MRSKTVPGQTFGVAFSRAYGSEGLGRFPARGRPARPAAALARLARSYPNHESKLLELPHTLGLDLGAYGAAQLTVPAPIPTESVKLDHEETSHWCAPRRPFRLRRRRRLFVQPNAHNSDDGAYRGPNSSSRNAGLADRDAPGIARICRCERKNHVHFERG